MAWNLVGPPLGTKRAKLRLHVRTTLVVGLGLAMTTASFSLCAIEKSTPQDKPGADNPPLQLNPGKTSEERLAIGAKKSLQVTLAAGEYAEITISPEQETELEIVIKEPGGGRRVASTEFGEIVLPLLASKLWTFEVAIHRLVADGSEGRFRVGLSTPRTPRPEDETRAAAIDAYAKAEELPANVRQRQINRP